MNLEKELLCFALEIQSDVSEHFLRNILQVTETTGYLIERCSLYSNFGQRSVTLYLNSELTKFYGELENDSTLQVIDDIVFSSKVQQFLEESQWYYEGHARFYETCAQIAAFSIFAVGHGYRNEDRTAQCIVNLARTAYYNYFLDADYDCTRYVAQSIFFTVFDKVGAEVERFADETARDIGWEEYSFELLHINFIQNAKAEAAKKYLSIPSSHFTTEQDKFEYLVKCVLRDFLVNDTHKQLSILDNFVTLAISITLISYCVSGRYGSAVRRGIDNIVKLVNMEKHKRVISYIASLYYVKMKDNFPQRSL